MAGVFALAVLGCASVHGVPDVHPRFQEISGLIESNLVGASSNEVDWLSVQGLLNELAPRVALSDSPEALFNPESVPNSVAEYKVLRTSVGYIQYAMIEPGAAEETREAYRTMNASNRLSGLVLDLRKASGDDYASALAVADLFLSGETPLMNWGAGLKSSTPKDDAITLPVAVLVDGKTGGSAEALAAILRQSGVALIIGKRTSGTAGIMRAFPLENGQFLRITISNVQLADATVIPNDGINPDVAVKLDAVEKTQGSTETVVVSDATGTNNAATPTMTRLDEADLVRRWRGEMLSPSDLKQQPRSLPVEERDPVLVRALDLMEGLAILQR